MINRRLFIKATAGTAVGSMFNLSCSDGTPIPDLPEAVAGRTLDRLGVQLYSVRTLMETDFEGTLQAVAGAGYAEVEFAGYFGNEPEKVRTILDGVGLAAPAAHISLETLRKRLPETIEHARVVGHRFLVCPSIPNEERTSIDSYNQLAAFLNQAGETCNQAGLRVGYHNHAFEFEAIDGVVPFDLLLAETDPDLVDFEIDLFWAIAARADPLKIFERFPGRFSLCHVKDMTADGAMADVGSGEIDFAAIFNRVDQAGLEHFIVEHDNPDDPISSIAASHDYLAALTY